MKDLKIFISSFTNINVFKYFNKIAIQILIIVRINKFMR